MAETNNNQSNKLIYGTSGNDSIYDYGDNYYNVSEYAKINAGKGNDLISLQSASNLIQYTSGDGNDKIFGFRDDSTLSIDGGAYSTKKSGDDIIVTVGKGKITLEGAANLSKVNIKGTKATLTVTDKTKSPVTVGSYVENVNASKRTTAVNITGNDLANKITGGAGNDSLFGQNGNDSLVGGDGKDILSGGAGNDSLWGNAGADIFYYAKGDGKDIIFGFENSDTLTLDGLDFTSTYNKTAGTVTLKVDGGSITLKNFTATTFHINSDIYKISGTKLVKK